MQKLGFYDIFLLREIERESIEDLLSASVEDHKITNAANSNTTSETDQQELSHAATEVRLLLRLRSCNCGTGAEAVTIICDRSEASRRSKSCF